MKRFLPALLMMIFIGIMCNPYEPDVHYGSISLSFESAAESGTKKAADQVGAVRLILWKGEVLQHNQDLNRVGNHFYGYIDSLNPGNDYSLYLLARKSGGDENIIGKAQKSDIAVRVGEVTEVDLLWKAFDAYPISPYNGEILNINQPVLTWQQTPSAVAYSIRIDDNLNFRDTEYIVEGLQDTQFSVPAPLPNGHYYWKLSCQDSLGYNSTWSAIWRFTVEIEGPAPPALLSPADGEALIERIPSFAWTEALDAVSYWLEIASKYSFASSIVYDAGITQSEHTVYEAFANGSYYWRVASRDNLENRGDWSAVRTFTVEAQGNESPLLVSPADGATVKDTTLLFMWDPLDPVCGYIIEISDDSTFESLVLQKEEWQLTNFTTSSLTEDGTFYWRVAGQYAGGFRGSWSDIWTFKIERSLTPFKAKQKKGRTP